VVVLGHVDHGKTSLLDKIRRTSVAAREIGGISQHIGASEIPAETITKICGDMLKQLKITLEIPGILFIDTPGHEAFTNLRERGGSISDISVLVVDATKGFEPQTLEALEILKDYKTPFVIAMNKIDMINGWIPTPDAPFAVSFKKQSAGVQADLDERLYTIVGKLHELGFNSERFDRVEDFTKQIVIIPLSAKTGEGISELLLFLSGLSQKYLISRLKIKVKGVGKGSIIEVKEEKGLGTTVDVILCDGILRKNDIIVFGTLGGAESTKVRALLKPKPLDEMRDPREKFSYVDEVHAASGVKIFAPSLEKAIAGSPIFVAQDNVDKLKQKIEKEIASVLIEKGGLGVMLRADTLGSLEAITKMLKSNSIPVSKAGIGRVSKTDVIDAYKIKGENRYYGIILAFDVSVSEEAAEEAKKSDVTILNEKIIYSLLENYKKWVEAEREKEKKEAFTSLVLPAKIKVLPGFCFRASNPAIFGVEILAGRIKQEYEMINENGEVIGRVKSIQKEKENLNEATAGMQVAISMDEPTYGRQVNERDVLYSSIPKEHAKLLLTRYREFLSDEEARLIEKIKEIISREMNLNSS
jgi:translation initiation factor 5B